MAFSRCFGGQNALLRRRVSNVILQRGSGRLSRSRLIGRRALSSSRADQMESLKEETSSDASSTTQGGLETDVRSKFVRNRSPSTEIHLGERLQMKKNDYDEFVTMQSDEVLNHPPTLITTLPNGLRVATETSPINHSTATVGVWIDTGSRYESKETNGVAHFLEHLAFKGTSKRTQGQLEVEVENIGGHLNAYTSREQTVYFAQSEKQHIPQCVDILSDIILNSNLTDQSIEVERGVILREMEAVYSDTDELVFDHLHETAFPDNALGQTILGPEENIRKINRDMIVNYIQTHYTADRMVICGAGAINHEDLVQLAQEKFAAVPKAPEKPVFKEPAKFQGSHKEERWDDMGLAYVALGYPTCGWKHENVYPLLFLHSMLGTWDKSQPGGEYSSSELVKIAACSGVCDNVMAFNTLYSDTGLLGVYFVSNPHRLQDACKHVRNEMTRLCYDIDHQMVAQAKNQVASNMLMSLDSSSAICEDIGRQILTLGRRIHPAEMIARINAVEPKDVLSVAREYLHDREHALAAVGALNELPEYWDIRDSSYWLRA